MRWTWPNLYAVERRTARVPLYLKTHNLFVDTRPRVRSISFLLFENVALSFRRKIVPREGKYGQGGIRIESGAARTSTTATTAGRLVLVACKDTVKLTARRLLQEQQRDRNRDTPVTTSSNEDIVEAIRLEDVAMKQEPEDEEDCYLEAAEISSPTSLSSGNRHASASHRVRSHARSLRAMTNPSAVWAHFDLCANDPLRAQCRICGAVVVRGGANPRQCGTTNLHRHLRVHHGGRLIGSRYQGNDRYGCYCWCFSAKEGAIVFVSIIVCMRLSRIKLQYRLYLRK